MIPLKGGEIRRALIVCIAFLVLSNYGSEVRSTQPNSLMPGPVALEINWARDSVKRAEQRGVKLYPVDEASKDRSFEDFRQKLRRAITKRDAKFILNAIDSEIRLGLGGERGMAAFKSEWKPEDRRSKFWRELGAILSLGGTFESTREGKEYCAPYVTTRWENLVRRYPKFGNAAEYMVVIRNNAEVRASPSLSAPVTQTLSFDVVRVAQPGGSQWLRIYSSNGFSGYVSKKYVRSPIDYSACFRKSSGRWMMVSLVAGD